MFSFHKPRVYRSTEGCCICRAKSSSSRFTDSKKYEDDSMKCFNLEKARQGEICNACVLLVKRFKRLPPGSNRHWGHVVDARIGPGMKSLTKFKKQREDTQQNSSENSKVQNSKPSTSSIPEKFCKIFKKNKMKKQQKTDKIKEKREGSPNSWDEQSLPPTPESLNSEDDASSSLSLSNNRANKSTNRIDRRKMLKPRKNIRKFSNIKFFDEQEWKRLNSCCGTVYENVKIGALIIDAETYRPCAYHHLRQQLITTNPPVINSLPATSYPSANIEIDKLWRITKKNTTLIHELNRKMHLDTTVNVVKDENTVQTPALKKHHLFFKRQLENFPIGDISTVNTIKTDLDSSSIKKTEDNNVVQSKDTTSKLRSTLLYKLKSDTGKIITHSLEKINTLRMKQVDLNEMKNLIKITDKTSKPRNVEDSANNVQCNLKSDQPANKFNDNSSDSGFDENLLDRKSISPMQQDDEDKDKKVLVRSGQGMFLANGTPIQSQPQNAIMSTGDAVTKRVQPKRQIPLSSSKYAQSTGSQKVRAIYNPSSEGVVTLTGGSPPASILNVTPPSPVPEEYVSKEVFDAINVYIIPKPQLQRCILTVNVLGFKIVGYPVRIDSQRYARNAFYFNLCFVCDAWARSVQYEPVVKKLSEYLIMMEEESGFLSKDDDEKVHLKKLLQRVLTDLNERKVTTIVEGENTIYLKIVTHKPNPSTVMDHLVPLLLSEYRDVPLEYWDLTTQQILPFINGVNHVARIAMEADVEGTLVKTCVQNLAYYGVVQLLPILKYSNVYMCTRSLQKLMKDCVLYQGCRKYVSLKHDRPKPTLQKIFQFYASMTHGITLRTICQRLCPQNNNIDERKLVFFGLQQNFIRCIHKYPVYVGSVPTGRQKLYTGNYNFDEICCKTGLSTFIIERDIESDPNITVIWK